ncbi:Protein of unknown function [Pyronema omphalodes CBS 100304]|uniref:Uncharacterized protein n=1 Tax=Pyronema omphalodes (strain CBS 100304) TaxID=1076935 RepID=U4L172_PYROM|nr:Protein of unknown function [Pyronema omphalodes CBS 100304]
MCQKWPSGFWITLASFLEYGHHATRRGSIEYGQPKVLISTLLVQNNRL